MSAFLAQHRPKLVVLGLATLVAGVALWPTSRDQAGYPFARRLLGEQPRPLFRASRLELQANLNEDVARLDQALTEMDAALAFAERQRALLATREVEDLSAEDRATIRRVWWAVLDPLLTLDRLKHRYEDWYGIDYLRHPVLHAMAYAVGFAALSAQVASGQALLALVGDNARVQTLFDEAMPEYGLPPGTFRAMRHRLSRVRDQSLLPIGAMWFDRWIAPHLLHGVARHLGQVTEAQRRRASGLSRRAAAANTLENDRDTVRSVLFTRWYPVQRDAAEWFGDTRVVPEDRRLISDAQIRALRAALRPGDIIVERRNWYLSNVGLPGFWPHAALYVGTFEELRDAFDADPDVTARYGGPFSAHLRARFPEALAAFEGPDAHGNDPVILEAVSEGVVAASLEHSCAADYVGAMRPRLAPVEIAAAIERALTFYGRPYDFNFDFGTDDAVVCSELVTKAYEGASDGTGGLRVPPVEVAGRRTIPPTELVRLFARERTAEDRQLDFVMFLDGREGTGRAVEGDARSFADSAERPKWDILQP